MSKSTSLMILRRVVRASRPPAVHQWAHLPAYVFIRREARLSVKRKKRKRLIRSGQPHFVPTEPKYSGRWTYVTSASRMI